MAHEIDWARIAAAIAHYKGKGYTYVEAPWFVSEKALLVTLPQGREGHRTQDGPLVGSAEQSFIQMMMDGALPPGKYVATTPCFRDDPVDELHQRYFMKVELIRVLGEEWPRGKMWPVMDIVRNMAWDAMRFFITMCTGTYRLPQTEDGFDIELNGIEIGSYGHREHASFAWIYGTGLAEPRFSIARQRTPHS